METRASDLKSINNIQNAVDDLVGEFLKIGIDLKEEAKVRGILNEEGCVKLEEWSTMIDEIKEELRTGSSSF